MGYKKLRRRYLAKEKNRLLAQRLNAADDNTKKDGIVDIVLDLRYDIWNMRFMFYTLIIMVFLVSVLINLFCMVMIANPKYMHMIARFLGFFPG